MIPFFDYRRQWQERRAEILDTIQRVLDSGQLILGREVQGFEAAFAAALACAESQNEGQAIGVNSGTDALVLAMRALGIGPGDEVITVPNTAVPTLSAIRIAGARPVLVDVADDTLLMDIEQLPAALSAHTKAIIPVHLHGLALSMDPLLHFARQHGLAVIEDCAQAFGSSDRGRAVGTMGDIGCFSFYPTKNLGAYGDGGLCFTHSPELATRLRQLRMYGFSNGTEAMIDGFNSRLDELQAAILSLKLTYFGSDLEKRKALAQRYHARLDPEKYRLPALPRERVHSFHIFAVRTPFRDLLKERLATSGIMTGIHYAQPLHLMPAFHDLGFARGSLPVAERAASELLSLPLFPELREDEQDAVIRALNEAVF